MFSKTNSSGSFRSSSESKYYPMHDYDDNCFLLTLRWIFNNLLGSLNLIFLRPLICTFCRNNHITRSSTSQQNVSSQRERAPFTLTVTDGSSQQLDIMELNRAQMYPFSNSHDFESNDRRLSCESTTSPNLVSFNFFPSSPLHSIESNHFKYEPKYKKKINSQTFSNHIAKKYLINTQPLSCAHLSVGRSYKLRRPSINQLGEFDSDDQKLLSDKLSHERWSLKQLLARDENIEPFTVDKRKRTILLERKNGSYGFTLQTYGIQYKKDGEVELITYVDHVDECGAAYSCGLLEGDVILSINGKDVEKADHSTLVNFIKSCEKSMRLVVRFEDCVNKVNLHTRLVKMKVLLSQKMAEYERVCQREKELLAKMNRGKSSSLKSVSSWSVLPHVKSIFPPVLSSPPMHAKGEIISNVGDSFKSSQSVSSFQSKTLSLDSGMCSNNSCPRSSVSPAESFSASNNDEKFLKPHEKDESICQSLNPITRLGMEEGQGSSLNQDKFFITRL